MRVPKEYFGKEVAVMLAQAVPMGTKETGGQTFCLVGKVHGSTDTETTMILANGRITLNTQIISAVFLQNPQSEPLTLTHLTTREEVAESIAPLPR